MQFAAVAPLLDALMDEVEAQIAGERDATRGTADGARESVLTTVGTTMQTAELLIMVAFILLELAQSRLVALTQRPRLTSVLTTMTSVEETSLADTTTRMVMMGPIITRGEDAFLRTVEPELTIRARIAARTTTETVDGGRMEIGAAETDRLLARTLTTVAMIVEVAAEFRTLDVMVLTGGAGLRAMMLTTKQTGTTMGEALITLRVAMEGPLFVPLSVVTGV